MGTVRQEFSANDAQFLSTSFPQYRRELGTNFASTWLAYIGTGTESAYWEWTALAYGSGNLSLEVVWGADTATSGVVRWAAAIAAITPDVDNQDPQTKAFATEIAVDDTHLGTTAHRLMVATINISNLDSLAAGDECWLRVSRLGGHANDTLSGDAWLHKLRLSYSDT